MISTFKNFFSKKGNTNKINTINFDEIRLTLKDALTAVKDCGFSVKMINYSIEPVTLQNLSALIIIKPNTSNYDINEFISELENSISHIEYNDMDVKKEISISDEISKGELYVIHGLLREIYPEGFRLGGRDQTIIGYLSNIDNFKNFITHPDVEGTVGDFDPIGKLKLALVVKLDITGEHEGSSIRSI